MPHSVFPIGTKVRHDFRGIGVVNSEVYRPNDYAVVDVKTDSPGETGHAWMLDYLKVVEAAKSPYKFAVGDRVIHVRNTEKEPTIGKITRLNGVSESNGPEYDTEWSMKDGKPFRTWYFEQHLKAAPIVDKLYTKDELVSAATDARNQAYTELEEKILAAQDKGYNEGNDAAFKSLLASEIRNAMAAAVEAIQPPVIIAEALPEDKTINQLLNELYHDRARLENVIQGAVKLAQVIVKHAEIDKHRLNSEGRELLTKLQAFVEQNK